MNKTGNLLEIKDLSVAFRVEGKYVTAVDSVSLEVRKGEILGLVGESGSGKSVTCRSIMRLIPDPPGRIQKGKVIFKGKDILEMSKKEMYKVRGNKISMIFQEPMTSLNPVYTCGNQIIEAILLHQKVNRQEARQRAIEMLNLVGIPMPEVRIDSYPHELSGGMRQRVMIAMALSCNPEILIADEPTTALDPTIQAQILDLIKQLQKKLSITVIFITHDLGVIAEICDRVAVMYAGSIVEQADVIEIFHNPKHPYTNELLKAIPKINEKCDVLHNIKGVIPNIVDIPKGCGFHPRCAYCMEKCKMQKPPLFEPDKGHEVRCWLFEKEINS